MIDKNNMPFKDYYRKNAVADTVVRCFDESMESNITDIHVDFGKFLKSLERKGVDWRGNDFYEVMFEVMNRRVLLDSFSKYVNSKVVYKGDIVVSCTSVDGLRTAKCVISKEYDDTCKMYGIDAERLATMLLKMKVEKLDCKDVYKLQILTNGYGDEMSFELE